MVDDVIAPVSPTVRMKMGIGKNYEKVTMRTNDDNDGEYCH